MLLLLCLLSCLHVPDDLPEADQEQDGGRRGGEEVRHRLGEEHREQLVLKKARQDQDQRDEQNDFTFQREEQRDLGLAQRDKALLERVLERHR